MNEATYNQAIEDLAKKIEAGSISPEEADQLAAEFKTAYSPSLGDKAKELGMSALSGLSSAIDWMGGLNRTALANQFDEQNQAQQQMIEGEGLLEKAKGAGKSILMNMPQSALPQLALKYFSGDDESDLVKKADIEAAAKGQAPISAEYLERASAPELGSVNLPLLGKVTGRGTIGLLGDIATDPTTYLTAGATKGFGKAAPIASTLLDPATAITKPLKAAMKPLGKWTYQKGLKAADIVSKQFGKGDKALSDVLLKRGITGGAESIADQATELASQLANQQKGILTDLTSRGVKVDLEQALNPIIKSAETMASEGAVHTPAVKRAASLFAGDMTALGKTGAAKQATEEVVEKVSPILTESGTPFITTSVKKTPAKPAASLMDASKVKTELYNQIGDEGYRSLGASSKGAKMVKGAANRIKRAVEQAASAASPKQGALLKEVNKELGTLLTSKKVMQREAAKEIMKNSITPVDLGLLLANPAVAASKKFGDFLKSMGARTRAGHYLYRDFNPYEMLLMREMNRTLKQPEEENQ